MGDALGIERSVLATCMVDPVAVLDTAAIVRVDDMSSNTTREVLRAVCSLAEKGVSVDIVTVVDEMSALGSLDVAGGVAAVSELALSDTVGSVGHLCRRIVGRSRLRQLATIGSEMHRDSIADEADAGDVLARYQERMWSVVAGGKEGAESVGQIMPRVFDHIAAVQSGKQVGIATGLKDVDAIVTGFGKGDLVIVAGRPGMGKTAFALHCVVNAAKAGRKVYVASYEMGKEQLAMRQLCSEAGVSMHQVNSNHLRTDDLPKLHASASTLYTLPVWIDDRAELKVSELYAEVRRQRATHGVDILFVDYLQLIPPSRERGQTRENEIAVISRSLKIMARMLGIPVVAMAQLNRGVEQRRDRRPMLSDLRESGSQEQDADVVMLLYRDDYYDENSPDKDTTEIIVAKHRNGPTGTAKVGSPKRTMTYHDLSDDSFGTASGGPANACPN